MTPLGVPLASSGPCTPFVPFVPLLIVCMQDSVAVVVQLAGPDAAVIVVQEVAGARAAPETDARSHRDRLLGGSGRGNGIGGGGSRLAPVRLERERPLEARPKRHIMGQLQVL